MHRYLRGIRLLRDEVPSFDRYPFSIPAVRQLDELDLDANVTFLIGDNGAGKSTLIEAIAVVAGFNAEGGTRNFNFATRPSESELHAHVRPIRGVKRPRDGFFLRAESLFNVATEIDRLGASGSYGGVSLHEQSHGGIRRVAYEETEHYTITRDFLNAPDRYFKTLFDKPDD